MRPRGKYEICIHQGQHFQKQGKKLKQSYEAQRGFRNRIEHAGDRLATPHGRGRGPGHGSVQSMVAKPLPGTIGWKSTLSSEILQEDSQQPPVAPTSVGTPIRRVGGFARCDCETQ